MIKKNLIAGMVVITILPSMAMAQVSCEQQQANRTTGTVVGAGIGALLGSAIAGRSDRTTGAIIGGIGGAVIGNQVAKSSSNCQRAYGFYDNDRVWHPSASNSQQPTGYYDRHGDWVDGAPNGHYSNDGNWVRGEGGPRTAVYQNAAGNWVPAAEAGHYDARGVWVEGSASGYYDSQGRWISTYVANPDRSYADIQTDWRGAPTAARARSLWLTERVQMGQAQGRLRPKNARQVLRDLTEFRSQEMRLRHYRGKLSRQDQSMMFDRLNAISLRLNWS